MLFIDELHTLVGAGASEGSLDASNMIKPALARGELRCIGATTLKEYQKYIEKDQALERRFQPVYVNEPTVDESVMIIARPQRTRYELHHGIKITDGAVVGAAKLSDRYITDRFLPDKAVDLIDEACSKMRIELDSLPEELDQISKDIQALKIQREALKMEKGQGFTGAPGDRGTHPGGSRRGSRPEERHLGVRARRSRPPESSARTTRRAEGPGERTGTPWRF